MKKKVNTELLKKPKLQVNSTPVLHGKSAEKRFNYKDHIFVFVGGLPRNGTVTTSTFLHLNDDVFAFNDSPTLASLNFLTATVFGDSRYFAQPLLSAVPLSKSYDGYKKYIVEKNTKYLDLTKDNFRYLVFRNDENPIGLINAINRKTPWVIKAMQNIKLIFPLRPSLEDMFFSFLWHGMLGRDAIGITAKLIQQFIVRVMRSFDHTMRLHKKGVPILVSNTYHKDHFKNVLDFLEIAPSTLQIKAMNEGFHTNATLGGVSKVAEIYAQKKGKRDRETYLEYVEENKGKLQGKFEQIRKHIFYRTFF